MGVLRLAAENPNYSRRGLPRRQTCVCCPVLSRGRRGSRGRFSRLPSVKGLPAVVKLPRICCSVRKIGSICLDAPNVLHSGHQIRYRTARTQIHGRFGSTFMEGHDGHGIDGSLRRGLRIRPRFESPFLDGAHAGTPECIPIMRDGFDFVPAAVPPAQQHEIRSGAVCLHAISHRYAHILACLLYTS